MNYNGEDIISAVAKLLNNIGTNMDVPSFAYEKVEVANKRRIIAKSELTLYDWCKQELNLSNEQK